RRQRDQRKERQDQDAKDFHLFPPGRARVSAASVVEQYRPKLMTVVTTVPRKKSARRRPASRRRRRGKRLGVEAKLDGVSRRPIGLTRGGSMRGILPLQRKARGSGPLPLPQVRQLSKSLSRLPLPPHQEGVDNSSTCTYNEPSRTACQASPGRDGWAFISFPPIHGDLMTGE